MTEYQVDPFYQERNNLEEIVSGKTSDPVSLSEAYIKSILTEKVIGKGFFGISKEGKDPFVKQCTFSIKMIDKDIFYGSNDIRIQELKTKFLKEQAVSNTL